MKYYLVAGEASGDLHGSNLIKGLKNNDPLAICRAWGGNLMEAAGAQLVKHYKDLAFMGFLEVVRNIRAILKNIAFCKADILEFRPDVVILIDYPGFNLRIAKWAKKNGFKVFYYISPQVWAWHQSRVHSIKRDVDKMFVILPFEQDFYQKHGVKAEFVGHPLLDAIQDIPGSKQDFAAKNGLSLQPIIGLLPGSRRQEIERILPVMLSVIPYFPGYQFAIGVAPSLSIDYYQQYITQADRVTLLQGQTYPLMLHSSAALVTSGTATLETALIGTPEVVCYKGNPTSYWIAKKLVKVPYISLVNLIANKKIVQELIQNDCNTTNLVSELTRLLDPSNADKITAEYLELKQKLGASGASERVARLMVESIR